VAALAGAAVLERVLLQADRWVDPQKERTQRRST
jgi:hypothetical protein